ncbi:MAG: LacI family DNA-binding transcriptional regulator [Treponema sp.]|nr:LacI family DNA-binding transcriptional regulator [Treponema sp.]
MQRVRMSDIANELGISTVTVSKALTGREGVGEKLRKTIIQKASELGYVYNGLPLAMRMGRNYVVGILMSAKYLGETSFYWVFYRHLLSTFKQTPYSGILEIVEDDEESRCVVPACITANKVDGLILLGQFPDPYLAMITTKVKRLVFLDFYSDIGACDCVASNNFLGSYNLTKLLIDVGHTRIGFIGSTSATTSILDRYMGFCKAMLEVELPYESAIDDRDERGQYIDFDLRIRDFTAYICNNDQLAGIVIKRLRDLGLKVPDDMSIVGFDNESELVTDGLGVTSLEVNLQAMSQTAIHLLIEHIENNAYQPRGRTFIDGRVVCKQSIAPPKVTRLT